MYLGELFPSDSFLPLHLVNILIYAIPPLLTDFPESIGLFRRTDDNPPWISSLTLLSHCKFIGSPLLI